MITSNKNSQNNLQSLNEILCINKADTLLRLLSNSLETSKLLVELLLDDEVNQIAGDRYKHKKETAVHRWGSNPGSVRIGSQKLKVNVPRLKNHKTGEFIPLHYYEHLNSGIIKDNLLEAITLGISQHDYKRIVQQSLSSFGLSQSSVSRNFQAEAEESLKEFENRDLSKEDIIALLIDGKTLASQQIVICMGVTLQGEKRVLGLLQTESENSNAIKGLFRNIINRGLDYSKGLLCIVDGSKGIEKALRETFGKFHIIQRCRWHKIENVCSHFKGEKSDTLKRRMNLIFKETDYDTARSRLLELVKELEVENISASRSLREGLEQTLTLQKLQMEIKFSTSFGTTNCIESLNSQIGRYVKRITRWKNSKQIFRWTGLAIIEAESRMNRIRNYKHLPKLRESLMNELKLKQVNKKNYKAAS